jgi:hypothetical protein
MSQAKRDGVLRFEKHSGCGAIQTQRVETLARRENMRWLAELSGEAQKQLARLYAAMWRFLWKTRKKHPRRLATVRLYI